MNNQDTNQTVLNSTSQDTKQPEAVAPVTDNQQTTPVTPAVDTKPTDNTQDTTASTPVAPTAPTVPDTVKLELTADQAEMIQTLLNDYVLAYRSDRSVDYKPEPVPREKVGQYPYVATAPAPEIINPTYDWINKKWYSKTNATDLSEIAQDVQSLQSNQEAGTTQSLALTKAVKQLSEGQADQEKLLASVIASAQKTAEPTAPTQSTQATNK